MLRVISARRGIARFQNGDTDLARQDIPSLAGFVALPAGAGYGPCERKVTVMVGETDHFALPYDPIPYVNPDFAIHAGWPMGKGLRKQFDELRDGEVLFASLILPPLHFCGAVMELRIRAGGFGYMNDMIGYGSAGGGQGTGFSQVGQLWDPRDDNERLRTFDVTPGFLLDVQRAQLEKKINSLDVTIGQHTTVDYIKLTLVY
jgi:hypothetical protein